MTRQQLQRQQRRAQIQCLLACLQFDTYREMRSLATAEWVRPHCAEAEAMGWANYTPGTNALWVAYLCDMLRLKRFKGLDMSVAEKKALASFRCACCSLQCLQLVLNGAGLHASRSMLCYLIECSMYVQGGLPYSGDASGLARLL